MSGVNILFVVSIGVSVVISQCLGLKVAWVNVLYPPVEGKWNFQAL